MFMLHMRNTFKVGDSANCKINGEPARVTWRDANHLVIEPNDVRPIVSCTDDGKLICFMCGDATETAADYQRDVHAGGFIVSPKIR
jgi:hypothetical protein